MSNRLEAARLEMYIVKIRAARSEMEFKILEREEEISRLKEGIVAQDAEVAKIEAQIKDLKAKGD